MKQRWNQFRRFVSAHRVGVTTAAVVGILAVGGGVYTAWSVSSWQQYEETAAQERQKTVASVRTALEMPADTSEARTTRLNALKEITQSQPATSACDMPGAIKWQQSLGSLGEKVERCNAAIETTTQLQNQVETTVAYLENERELASILSSADQAQSSEDDKPTVKEAKFSATRDSWNEIAVNVAKLKATEGFSETKNATETEVKAVSDAWKKLVAAHEKKDRKAFEAAKGTLADAYQKLSETAKQSEKAHANVITSLEDAAAKSESNA